jgi:hypothetical protein
MNRTWIPLLAAALFAGAASAAGGCSLVFGIHEIPEGSGGAGGRRACDDGLPCDNANPCGTTACKEGFCVETASPDGPAPASAQIAANCNETICVAGVAEQQNDSQDIEDDGEPCTVDTCVGGNALHTAVPDATGCSKGPNHGLCFAGACQILCVTDTACDDKNPCTQDACDTTKGTCTFTALDGMNTPGVAQVDGDCRTEICVKGVSTSSPEDTDLPTTPSPCDSEICTSGVPSNPPLAVDTSCTKDPFSPMFCDGAGACVQCTQAAQCGSDTDCLKHTCTAGVCAAVPAPVKTPLAMQTPGDCHAVVCDGAGAVLPQPIVDDTDTKSDNNDCTTDLCTNGILAHIPLNPGDPCGNGQQCNAAIQCGCSTSAQCTAPATCGGGNPGTPFTCGCAKTTCALLGATCGTPPDACGSTLACNTGTKNGTETDVDCGGGGGCATPCAQGMQCAVDTDCGTGHCADGVCCSTACSGLCQACSAAKKGGGLDGTCGNIAVNQQDTTAPQTCTGVSACDGAGACKKALGQACVSLIQCANKNCVEGACCGVPSCPACQSCLAGNGACGNLPIGPDTVGPATCSNTLGCDGVGNCKKVNGQACNLTAECATGTCLDGVCCGSVSCPTCQSCAASGNGTCANIANGMPDTVPPGACPTACDGFGICKTPNGLPCPPAGATDCVSGLCADGVCCGSACDASSVCASCNGAMPGTCNVVKGGDDPDSCPAATSTCSMIGACLSRPGQPCFFGAECASGICLGGSICQ